MCAFRGDACPGPGPCVLAHYSDPVRVVQVSAHYPPNFVSGGTLVPQRLAHALADRGHEVLVYAGHLDASLDPLTTWEETDDHGVRVRWVVTTPWTSWSDPLNSVNPAVEADAAAWFAQVRPDVVHVHSLQTLGGGVLAAARASGAVVVVTMHDFWWTCARQFLMPADGRGCSPVVSCGGCPCSVDHRWLEQRNAALRPFLDHADAVLAPSRSAARLLVANGVPEDLVRVDEAGVPAGERITARHIDSDGPVRFLFAGGDDPMKGIEVLLEAARELEDDGTWALDLHGVPSTRHGVPSAAHPQPSFSREALGEVMAAHDVLVLPSLMRESYSILTREALASGLAVICSDSIGPEEVVVHGENGFVVPTGEAAPLAEAMRRLSHDPALLRRMGSRADAVALRTLDEQAGGIEVLYRGLLDRNGTSSAGAAVRLAEAGLMRRVVFVVGIQGAPLRYRAQLAAEGLRLHGVAAEVRHYRDPELPRLLGLADAVVVYRVPATVQVMELLADVRARPRTVPILFDVDDLIMDPGLAGEIVGLEVLDAAEHELWWRGVARYRTTLEACDAYIGSTDGLCEHVGELTGLPTHRWANGVGRVLARASEVERQRPRSAGPLRIGYFSGTKTHDADWAVIETAVARVLRERPGVELWLGGLVTAGPALDEFAGRVRRLPMMPWTELPAALRDVDVNLAPLVLGNRFNEAKSAIKWLEAALVDTPTVASPTQPFTEAVEDGRTGVLARTEEQWVDGIGMLLDDELARRRMGALAGREALLRWGPHLQGERYLEILLDAAQARRADPVPRTSDWEPVVDDEPASAVEAWVEPYRLADAGRAPGRWHLRLTTVRRVYDAGGVAGLAAKVRTRLLG